MSRVLLLATMALIGCDTSKPPPCPGTKVGNYRFQTTDGGSSSCSFDGGQPAFAASLAWDPEGASAALCPQRPYATPSLGTHDGGHVVVESISEGNTVVGCGNDCLVTIRETVDGVLSADGAGFSGVLRNDLTGVPAGDGGTPCGCQLPCQVVYPLQGTLDPTLP